MWRCESGSVRQTTKHQSDHCAHEVQTFCPCEHPLVAVEVRARLHVGEIRAGVRLRVALAPDLLARDDRRQEAPLLLVGAEGDDGRAEQSLADVTEAAGSAGARVLLVEDHLLHQRRAAAAVLARPADAGPAARRELLLPGAPLVDQRVLVAGTAAAAHARELAGERVGQPGRDLAAERFVFGREPEVHETYYDTLRLVCKEPRFEC